MLVKKPALSATTGLAVAALVLGGSLAAAGPAQAVGTSSTHGLRLAQAQPGQNGATIVAALAAAKATKDKNGRAHLIIKLRDKSLASYTGGVAGLAATSPQVTHAKRLDVTSASSRQYLSYFSGRVSSFQSRVQHSVPSVRFGTRLATVVGGVAVSVPVADAAKLAADPQVEAVYPDTLNHPDAVDRSPGFIGAPSAWNRLGGPENAGENVIVGVLDTGIWPEHPSLSDPDPSGKPYPAPRPRLDANPRQCDFSSGANPGPAFTCNNKLIGAYTFMSTYAVAAGFLPGELTSARDDDGHGTHTSTTAAGNAGVAASMFGIPRGTVSGIAPRAHVIMYRVCGSAGCYSSDSAAAVQQAIVDDVDVLNFSISGGANPYGDAVSLAFLDAYNAGIFVAASAGNSGPAPDTTDHREPWVTTVAASSLDRAFVGSTTLASSDSATLTVPGMTITPSLTTPTPLVDAGAAPYNDPLCQSGTADGAFTGKVVICKRGGNGRVAKGANVATRGGVGMILYNPIVEDQETDNHLVPAIHVNNTDGASVLAFLGAHPDVTATIATGAAKPAPGDVMAYFSSRGGPGQTLGVSKPDVTAPGLQILAGNTPLAEPAGQLFQAIAGTSMSSPHVAGAGAMLVSLHPTWTPGQIKSALMTTAVTSTKKEDGVSPTNAFDDGSGRIDLRRAPVPLFTFDESGANYVADKDALYKANYPSLYVPALAGSLTVQRTLTSVAGRTQFYSVSVQSSPGLKVNVSPSSFSIVSGATRTISITVDGRDIPIGETRFATVTFRSGSTRTTFPVTVVRHQGPVTVDKTCAPDPVGVGASTTCTVSMTNNSTSAAALLLLDKVPSRLSVNNGSVVGGTNSGNTVLASVNIPGKQAPAVNLGAGSTPVGGYLGLSNFGIQPIAGIGDDTMTNFNVPAFTVAGITYTSLGVGSNGYVVLGGGSGPDISVTNQDFPNTQRPNNVLAGFWTDLNPGVAGAVRIATLTDGADTWIVVDYDGVREYSTAGNTHTFEFWIGINGDANPGEDVSIGYGPNTGPGDLGFATVGVENPDGTQGDTTYYDGTGTLPSNGLQYVVTGTPGLTSTATVTYTAKAKSSGGYVNYVEVTGNVFDGTAISRFAGTVSP